MKAESSKKSKNIHIHGLLLPAAKYLFLLLGALFLALLIRKIGLDRLVTELRRMGWGLVPYVAIHALKEALAVIAWQASFSDPHSMNWWRLYRINWVSATVNQIYSTGLLGSGATKVIMARQAVSTHKAAASVLVSTQANAFGQIFYISCGLFFVLKEISTSPAIRAAVWTSFSILTVFVFAFWIFQAKGRLGALLRMADRIPLPAKMKALLASGTALLDDSLRRYHRRRSGRFLAAVILQFLRRFLDVAQIQLVLYFLQVPGGFRRCFVISVFSALVGSVFFFIPGRLGALEGGKVLIAKSLGMTEAQGLTLGIASRLSQVVWSVMGIALYFLERSLERRNGDFDSGRPGRGLGVPAPVPVPENQGEVEEPKNLEPHQTPPE